MLKILKSLKKKVISRPFPTQGGDVLSRKRSLPASKEWYNALYTFEKNPVRFLPAVHKDVFKLIYRYLNMKHKSYYKKISWRALKYFRGIGCRVWISTPEIKHWSDKMTITVFVLDKIYKAYKNQMKTKGFSWSPDFLATPEREDYVTIKDSKIRKKVREKYPLFVGKNVELLDESQEFYIRVINWLKNDIVLMRELKSNVEKQNNKDIKELKIEHYSYLIDLFKKELIYLRYKQKILFHEFKYKEFYLTILRKFLESIYKKKIEFRFIKLKYFYLSSSILSQILVAKTTMPKYRGKSLKAANVAMGRFTVPNLSGNKLPRIEKRIIDFQNIIIDDVSAEKNKDYIDEFVLKGSKSLSRLSNYDGSKIWSAKNIDSIALSNLVNKSVSGVFIKLAGRLTKRYKAQRAVYKFRRKGTLQNVHSAHKGFPSKLSRGYSNINVEKTIIHSKIRIGAFGLTGWVASY